MTKKLYFLCPENKKPVGGVKQLYRQVDILNKNNFEAYIVHKKKGFRYSWFENNTRIIYNPSLFKEIDDVSNKKTKPYKRLKNWFRKFRNDSIDQNGILIIPEIYDFTIGKIKPGMKKVVFNQNCFYSFNGYDLNASNKQTIYLDEELIATIVVSNNSKEYLHYVFPSLNLFRIHLGIDNSKFYPEAKKKQIAFMPRKLEEEITQIINILKFRNNLSTWELVSIDNKTEDEVAQILRESAIFLSFNHKEGFGLPPAEAMASGCVVIGYTGKGGNEYFKEDFSFPINDGDIIEFAKKIEEVTIDYVKNKSKYLKISDLSSNFIHQNYNLKNEEETILDTWNKILDL